MTEKIILSISLLSVALIVFITILNTSPAWALVGNGQKQTILASDDIKNNPLAMKILQNIELSKQRMNEQTQKQLAIQQEQKFIEEQRKIANEYLQKDLGRLYGANSLQQPVVFTSYSYDGGNQVKSTLGDKKQITQQGLNQQNKLESHSITGADLKNDPLTQKILNEIEYSKKQIAQFQQNKKDLELIDNQRKVAKSLEEQALQLLQAQTEVNSSKNSFERFVSTVGNNDTKKVFVGEFNLMNIKVDAGHIAMKRILDNGGTWEDAVKEFSKYAGVGHIEMIQANKNLNVQYGSSNPIIQTAFDEKGLLPDDYIKVPNSVSSH